MKCHDGNSFMHDDGRSAPTPSNSYRQDEPCWRPCRWACYNNVNSRYYRTSSSISTPEASELLITWPEYLLYWRHFIITIERSGCVKSMRPMRFRLICSYYKYLVVHHDDNCEHCLERILSIILLQQACGNSYYSMLSTASLSIVKDNI